MTIRLPVLIAVAALAGCSSPAPEATPSPTPSATPSPVEAPPSARPTPTRTPFAPPMMQLPKPLLGTWTADKGGKCTPGTELRIVVEPTQIRFYESVARIVSVTQVDPHSWGIDAEVTGEGETRKRSFDLNLNEDERGTMTRVEAPFPDITYTRCPKGA